MANFRAFHFHAVDRGQAALAPADLVPMAAAPELPGLEAAEPDRQVLDALAGKSFNNDESAARHYMNAAWAREPEGPLLGITAPESPAVVPDLRFGSVQESPTTNTRLLHFNQTSNNLPVLGGKAVVELNSDRNLVSIDANIAGAPDVSPIATLSPADALGRVAAVLEAPLASLGSLPAPTLTYFHPEGESWHLVYEVRGVPAAPAAFRQALESEEGHGLGPSPQQERIDMTYLVDARDGGIVLYYSESPWLDIPSSCSGLDELNTQQTFFGFQNSNGAFEMRDPIRNLRTLDFQFGNVIQDPAPTSLVTNASFDFAGASTAAVSAHVNAARVYDFYNDVLKRDSVDDKGMELVSVVNCTYQPPGTKVWTNAVWYQQRMWYGQVQSPQGSFSSYSRYLDVIAHELTHGVTETTAALKYLNESGALNESFSDICAIIIKNLYGASPEDVSAWDWEIGSGLGKNGGPLRDLQDPKRVGQPDHMNDYKNLPYWTDSGGVHTNSNIHNKAAYNVLTAKEAGGNFIFQPKQVALFYYLTLTRLSSFATFADVLATLQNVIRTFWAGRPQEAQARVDAVLAAYDLVGIRPAP